MTELTEHQQNWWGTQPCRRCNPLGLPNTRPVHFLPKCPDCNGSGWTVWAAMATEPWSEIIPRLWVGGHDYNAAKSERKQRIVSAYPEDRFDLVVSMYHRDGFAPSGGDHIEVLFHDATTLSSDSLTQAIRAAREVADRVEMGQDVLVRCQAGLNRASLIGGLSMVWIGYDGKDAIQLLRARRSPWALCNEYFEAVVSESTIESMTAALAQDDTEGVHEGQHHG